MALKKWEIASIDKELAKELAEECDVDPFVALIAASRGYDDPLSLEEYLCEDGIFGNIYDLPDINEATRIINESVANNEKIAIYGDYDCDGITATAILYRYLTYRGAKVSVYIPDRISEGYGMTKEGIDKLISDGVSLIVTVDNGVSCVQEVAYAKAKSLKVVITDHHLPPEELPLADALVDPHLKTSECEFKEICGAMVAFKLVCALEEKEPEEMLEYYGELAAIGTIGDVMPLIKENRAVVKAAVPFLKKTGILGVSALISVAGIKSEELEASKVAFGIVPRLNAAGRLGSALRAFDLLVTDDTSRAVRLADEICEENSKRQQIEKGIYSQAVEIIENESLNHNRVIVVWGENWHLGVLGIVAARICEKYAKPTIVVSNSGEFYCGSGRSLKGFSLYNAVDSCNYLLEKFGGHELAAGITLKEENLVAFRKEINEYALEREPVCQLLSLDCKLNPAGLSIDLAQSLKQLEPYGHQNPAPIFAIFGVRVERITSIGNNKHIRLLFSKGETTFNAIYFSVSKESFCFDVGDIVDIAVTLEVNSYEAKEYLSVIIKDIKPNGIESDDVIFESFAFDDFCVGKKGDYSKIKPTREEFALVYKHIMKKSVTFDGVCTRFAAKISPAKTMVILNALIELSLAKIEDNDGIKFIKLIPQNSKVDLNNAPIIKRFEN